MRYIFGSIIFYLSFNYCFLNIEACHNAMHGGFYRGEDNITFTSENVTEGSPEEALILLSGHSLPQEVIDCVINHGFGSSSRRKKRSMSDVSEMLAQAGATSEIIQECRFYQTLCTLTLMCIENLEDAVESTQPPPTTTTTTTTATTTTAATATTTTITAGNQNPNVFVDEPLFPRLPGATHRLKMYCRFCEQPYCQNYKRCKWR